MLFGRDRICAVVAARSAREMEQQLRRALRWTRTVELRLDYLESRKELERFTFWLARHRPGCPMMKLPTPCTTLPRDTTYLRRIRNPPNSFPRSMKLARDPLYGTLVATLRAVRAGGRFTGNPYEQLAFLA